MIKRRIAKLAVLAMGLFGISASAETKGVDILKARMNVNQKSFSDANQGTQDFTGSISK